jgi:hypothetical protein
MYILNTHLDQMFPMCPKNHLNQSFLKIHWIQMYLKIQNFLKFQNFLKSH